MSLYHFTAHQSQFGIIVNYYKQLGILINNDHGHKIQPPITTGVGDNLSICPEQKSVNILFNFNTLRTGEFKLFTCMFPGSKQFKSTFIMCFFKYL